MGATSSTSSTPSGRALCPPPRVERVERVGRVERVARWGVESIGRNAIGAGLVPAPNATPCNVVTALSFIYFPR